MKTKQEVVKFCLRTYKKGLKEIKPKDSRERTLSKLRKRELFAGVCHFLIHSHISMNNSRWINSRKNFESDNSQAYWCTPPMNCNSKKEIIDSLNYRINILKSHLK